MDPVAKLGRILVVWRLTPKEGIWHHTDVHIPNLSLEHDVLPHGKQPASILTTSNFFTALFYASGGRVERGRDLDILVFFQGGMSSMLSSQWKNCFETNAAGLNT